MTEKKNNFRNKAFVALGSNKGDSLSYLRRAVNEILSDKKCEISSVSSIYETKAYGNVKQNNFLNCAAELKTNYSLKNLFYFLKETEKKLGRTETVNWGPREIDLDLLFFNDIKYSDDELHIPHKGIQHRDFVLVPLCEIAPDLIHPELNLKICDICNSELEINIIKKLDKRLY